MSSHPEHQLEIWHIPTVMEHAVLQSLQNWLSAVELQRAQRIHDEVNRNTYITTHAAMRLILAMHLHIQPAAIGYTQNTHGKPQLEHDRPIHFNLSHTHAYALLALSPVCQVGIDIEIIKPSRDTLAIARRFFSADEYSWLSQADPQYRNALFYQLWCHKEACLKAGGQGLKGGLASFSLTEQDLLRETVVTDRQQKQWRLQPIDVPAQYRAAIAIDKPDITPVVQQWQYSGH